MMRALQDSGDGGVAFFGAGASAEAGFPMWDRLHKEYLQEFNAEPAAIDAVRTDIDYHANRDPDRALCFVKRKLGRPVGRTPRVVRLALETDLLRYFYTTNFDEVLFEAACGREVAEYPRYQPMTARFIYLHGRASRAQSIHEDLVFGEIGYRKAYEEPFGGLTKAKLRQLVSYPVVFIGFSMTDTAVMRSLYEIADAARRWPGEPERAVSESIAHLDWYALLPAPFKSDEGRVERKRQTQVRLESAGVCVIWYQQDEGNEHTALVEVLGDVKRKGRLPELMTDEPGFAESMLQAEALAEVEAPTPIDLNRALAIVQGPPRIAAAFYERVAGLAWFDLLRSRGALDPQPSFEAANGVRSAPYWHASQFVQRTAVIAPSEVAAFLSQFETDNWVAIEQAVRILGELDEPSATGAAGPIARSAVNAMTTDQFLLYSLSETATGLNSGGKREAALTLTEVVIDELAKSRPALRAGTVSKFVDSAAPILAGSETGPEFAAQALVTALEQQYGSAEQDEVRFTRPAIERNRKNHARDTVVDLLIDTVRDTLLKTSDPARRALTVERLLDSPWPTARRIGIAHCFLAPADLSRHEAVVITRGNFSDRHVFHEFATLIASSTGDLTESSLGVIRDFVGDLHDGWSEDEQYEYRIWARVIPEHLLPEPLPASDDDDDEPDRHLFRDVWMSDVYWPSAPLDAEAFRARASGLGPTQLLELVRDPAGSGVRVTWRHDPEAMWTLLADYAKETRWLDPLISMTSEDVSRSGSWRAVEAMPEIAADDEERWGTVLDWAAQRLAEVADADPWRIALLIEKSSSTVPLSLAERARAIALNLVRQTKRPSWDEESNLAEDSLLGGFLNRPCGKALQALLELAVREMAAVEASTNGHAGVPQWFRSGVLEVIERDELALGIDAWVGVGRYYALLVSRSPEAVAFVERRLESETSVLSTATLAFWGGHLWNTSVWPRALERLQKVYRMHAPTLQRSDSLDEHLREAFFHHIVMGALRGIGGYGDVLEDTLGPSFKPQARAWVASALGRELERSAEGDDEQYRSEAADRFQRYWEAHVDHVGGSDGDGLATYLLWLDELGRPPAEIGRLIEVSLAHATDGSSGDQVLQYLASYVEEAPEHVLTLFEMCVGWYRLRQSLWFPRTQAQSLLEGLAPQVRGDPTLVRVLDGLAELGAISTEDIRNIVAPSGPTGR